MSALVEAIARGMAEVYHGRPVTDEYLFNPATGGRAFSELAVACLRAMAEVEPSESMTLAAAEAAYENDHFDNIYRAMLRQAVAEAEKGSPNEKGPEGP